MTANMADQVGRVLLLSEELMSNGQLDEALAQVAAAVGLHPANPSLLWRQADLLSQTDNPESAFEAALLALLHSDGNERIGQFTFGLLAKLPDQVQPLKQIKEVLETVSPGSRSHAFRTHILRLARLQSIREGSRLVQVSQVVSNNATGSIREHIGRMDVQVSEELEVGNFGIGSQWTMASLDDRLECVYFIRSSDRAAVRDAAFCHFELARTATHVADLALEHLDLEECDAPGRIRYVFSPARSGTTLLTRILNNANVPTLSEPAIPFHLASPPGNATHHLISDETAAQIAAASVGSHFDSHQKAVMVKLHAAANRRPSALFRPQDDAVFMWRDSVEWFRSVNRTLRSSPRGAVELLERAIFSYAYLLESRKIRGEIWYDQLSAGNLGSVGDLLHDLWPNLALKPYEDDSQAGTWLAREIIAQRPPTAPEAIDAFRTELGKSSMRSIARDVGLGRLFEDAVTPRSVPWLLPSRGSRTTVTVAPVPYWGSVEHYYHFLLGYLLPIVEATHLIRRSKGILVRDCGPMNVHFAAIADRYISVIDRERFRTLLDDPSVLAPRGFDHVNRFKDPKFKDAVRILYDILDLEAANIASGNLLLVDRCPPDPFYKSERSESKTSGSDRRSIPNMDDLQDHLSKQWKVRRVCLEGMSLLEQAQAFRGSDVIVAQHGAALSNIIFCNPQTLVVEIDPQRGNPIFADLARTFGVQYARMVQTGMHAEVDPKDVSESIASAKARKLGPDETSISASGTANSTVEERAHHVRTND